MIVDEREFEIRDILTDILIAIKKYFTTQEGIINVIEEFLENYDTELLDDDCITHYAECMIIKNQLIINEWIEMVLDPKNDVYFLDIDRKLINYFSENNYTEGMELLPTSNLNESIRINRSKDTRYKPLNALLSMKEIESEIYKVCKGRDEFDI